MTSNRGSNEQVKQDSEHSRGSNEETLDTDINYDPEKSDQILTECPACGTDVVVFQSGEIAEMRTTTVNGEIRGGLLSNAFRRHYCPKNDREWICHHCKTQWDNEDKAQRCCYLDNPQEGYSLVSEYAKQE